VYRNVPPGNGTCANLTTEEGTQQPVLLPSVERVDPTDAPLVLLYCLQAVLPHLIPNILIKHLLSVRPLHCI